MIELLAELLQPLWETPDVKRLNVGSDNASEHHWRFRLPDGSVVNLSITREKD